MVLDFGLIKSGLFADSELTGLGLGGDLQQSVIAGAGVNWVFDREILATAVENINITGLTKTHYLLIGTGDVNGVNDWELTLNGITDAEYDFQHLRADGATVSSGETANGSSGAVTNNVEAVGFFLVLEVFVDAFNSRLTFFSRWSQVGQMVLTGGRATDTAASVVSAIKLSTGNAAHTFDGRFYLYSVPTRA